MVTYRREIEQQVLYAVKSMSRAWVSENKLFVYPSYEMNESSP